MVNEVMICIHITAKDKSTPGVEKGVFYDSKAYPHGNNC
jgi:hypothetical protein